MRANPYPGAFIVIEGIDGSGKSLQADFIEQWLVDMQGKKARDVLKTHQPSKGAFGAHIRDILEGKEPAPEDPFAFQELYMKDRKEHMRDFIVPHLKKGGVVIADRFFLSTFAYGMAHGASFEALRDAHERIVGDDWIIPDVTFLIDINPAVALVRLKARAGGKSLEYFEKKEHFLERVAVAYRDLSKKFPVRTVSGDRPIAEVSEAIHRILAGEKKITYTP
ncbi:dTMP kinase [Candidatus Azambacteria bacterium RIFCSPHIGHO2_02_FULL_52_12]|uniref:Thymidylate kinase n=1 Tax=Candidatus Azambacteria bacterium RIFCSPLOWO2_01_FULL_46_25 TaxID=1797298 RepID=A0A1F5BVE1_9BACT|nr:MAG: dTMP kinase [Candidatus Azambacteria bacterium RIFCSPHIGHO2_02_FULL_52_12]OGD34574.1 MAG: dTMP kinase [Candidatus Azambacteria bacterium RIFCSPLOWO2_01_FULL_46_25]OGD37980.1 MAG: dTMP kinase [Candidatus Azambacteria bacterium RIFCSPHIGHO2_01_FULL_51_74]